jgi:ankyrin repeat protein
MKEKTIRELIAIVNLLISHGADVTHADRYGVSALYCSVETDRVDVARILLKYGANPNKQVTTRIDGPSGQTALHTCRSARMATLLLAYGADPKIKDATGQTAIDKFNTANSPFSLIKTSSGWHIREK